MPVSASEIEKLESSKRKVVRTRYTEEYRLEAVHKVNTDMLLLGVHYVLVPSV